MEEIFKEWRQFQESRNLQEDLAHIRFPKLKRVTTRPETQVKTIKTKRQLKLFYKKFINKILHSYKKATGRAIEPEQRKELESKIEKRSEDSSGGTVETHAKLLNTAVAMANTISKEEKGKLKKIIDKIFSKESNKEKLAKAADLRTTKKHEGLHYLLVSIKEEYSVSVYKAIVTDMINIYKEENENLYNFMEYFLKNAFKSYKNAKEFMFYEEILAWTRNILSNKKHRENFSKFVQGYYEYDSKDELNDVMIYMTNEMKKIWKKIVNYANNVEV